MQYFNLKDPSQVVSFGEAIQLGLGNKQGLFMPSEIPEFYDRRIEELLNMPFAERSVEILAPFLAPEFEYDEVKEIVLSAFNFPIKLSQVNETKNQHVVELFHGPSLAFKDFGARFLARCLSKVLGSNDTSILTATSGDTGAAVAHAFYAVDNVRVVILYPKGKVAPLQEKLFSTLGYNIETLAIDGDFDACQALVKQAFSDDKLREEVPISSANSINIARLLAQVCYYFEIMAQQPQLVNVCVPSGNFGNLTAGLIAKVMGLPVQKFMAATNANDTVPRFLQDGTWAPKQTIATITNAMDVAQPNNFPRVEYLARAYGYKFNETIFSQSVSESQTKAAVKSLYSKGYIADPHTALGVFACREWENVAILGTAHPAKFIDVLADQGIIVELPPAIAEVENKESLAIDMANDYGVFRAYLSDD